jgi:hypothetical protein
MTTIDLPLLSNKRECGTCTKCCEGWLAADIRGYPMFPGKPCFFVEQGVGCKDYENRPKSPCQNFDCSWIKIPGMPEEFKPEFSNVIISEKDLKGMKVISVNKAPDNPSPQLLSWIINYVLLNRGNIVWMVDDKTYFFGSQEFCEEMKKSKHVK